MAISLFLGDKSTDTILSQNIARLPTCYKKLKQLCGKTIICIGYIVVWTSISWMMYKQYSYVAIHLIGVLTLGNIGEFW